MNRNNEKISMMSYDIMDFFRFKKMDRNKIHNFFNCEQNLKYWLNSDSSFVFLSVLCYILEEIGKRGSAR